MPRIDGRKNDELRTVEIIPHINKFAEGSCLIRCGNTHVLCTASVEDRPPRHVPEGEGWVTAEYSMLPRANRERSRRDISKLKLNGRSAEIQRLIGRALRSVVDMKKLGPWNITIDCDVLQGDGGTRTASITGGFVAMMLAFRKMMEAGQLTLLIQREGPLLAGALDLDEAALVVHDAVQVHHGGGVLLIAQIQQGHIVHNAGGHGGHIAADRILRQHCGRCAPAGSVR